MNSLTQFKKTSLSLKKHLHHERTRSGGDAILKKLLLGVLLAAVVGAAPATAATQAVITGRTLRVTGDDFPNDIAIAIVEGNFQVSEFGQIVPIEIRGSQKGVRNVLVDARGGDDQIAIEASLVRLRASLDGGEGNDALTVNHDGNSLLVGGDGDDTVWGGGGDDLLNGGLGNDALNGGAGQDTIDGDAGADTLDGGARDGQSDALVGGTGPDIFLRYAGENDLIVDFNEAEGDIFLDIP
jgi:RTX calcium-binding nonapeptide repeat (4 copies)